eukprot:COSAG04_NODE_23352_length_340_cov_0.634855_2_plen_28_part_01
MDDLLGSPRDEMERFAREVEMKDPEARR